uniref:NIF3-like protein 1 n=1 Tax=Oryctolagus cuniculus TaxID=9986 RepID=A0A5F9CL82_RABIT
MLSSCLHLVPMTVWFIQSLNCNSSCSFMGLKTLISSLNDFASLSSAESWDNVGLLVEPSPPQTINVLFLTNDLTEQVMEEALHKKAHLIFSYLPPIFLHIKPITWIVGIYSLHTAYDAAPQGLKNWLSKGLGEKNKDQPELY